MSILVAMLLDRFFGEPPARYHPVVWIGHDLNFAGRKLTALSPAKAFIGGLFFWTVGAAIFTAAFAMVGHEAAKLPFWAECVIVGVFLKPLLTLQLLLKEVSSVETALAENLDQGRRQLSRIVSRDTTNLTATEVRESALESLSENLSDSLIAPLFWFVLFGLPGAAFYRFANTADAMWGYRGKWEWAGKWAARADDVLNFVPARLTALILFIARRRSIVRFAQLRQEAARTPSPNSGWPMAALAVAHGIRLGKPGVYVLNGSGSVPTCTHAEQCLRHTLLAGWLAAGIFACVTLFHLGVHHG